MADRKTVVSVRLNDEELGLLEKLARGYNLSNADTLRRAIVTLPVVLEMMAEPCIEGLEDEPREFERAETD